MAKKIYFKMIFDATQCNPNGDPSSNNRPRTFEGNNGEEYGFMTNSSVGRKLRDIIYNHFTDQIWEEEEKGKVIGTIDCTGRDLNNEDNCYQIFVKDHIRELDPATNKLKEVQNGKDKKIQILIEQYNKLYPNSPLTTIDPKNLDIDTKEEIIDICKRLFYDVRMFGLVANLKGSLGHIHGAFQIAMPISVDPVNVTNLSITQEVAEKDSESSMGTRPAIDYGLFTCSGYCCNFNRWERDNHITEKDIKILKKAFKEFGSTNSSTRQLILRKVYFYEVRDSNFNEADLDKLFSIKKCDGITKPIKYEDYEIIHNDALCEQYGIVVDKVINK